ncbi:MAG: UDPGP type 1 family protein [Patescibacteria group bacterium]
MKVITTNDLIGAIQPQAKLEKQLKNFDLSYLASLAQDYVVNKPMVEMPKDIQAVKTYSRNPTLKQRSFYKKAEMAGRELVREGKVGAFLVAGGQGTRLGYDGPKGEYSVTPVKNKSLFQVFAEQLLSYSKEAGKTIPWYIMTSDINRTATEKFFVENKYFGYNKSDIFFFEQGMMPAFDMTTGKLLLAEKDSLALSPDGHGGSLKALRVSGALADMQKRGIEHLSYFQVDNPMVHAIDYRFLGMHALTDSEMSSKVVPKVSATEKVGNFVVADGKVQVIEYSDMPEELAKTTNSDGSLKFNAGSIAIHALSVKFIERLTSDGNLKLPWHRAEKKVAFLDASGALVKPEKPNAVKLEQFIFDALPLAQNALVYETDRAEEFSPVKNAEGNDSPLTSRQHQVARAQRWLKELGVEVHPESVVEIDPLFAASRDQLKARKLEVEQIVASEKIYFGHTGIESSATQPTRLPLPFGMFKKVGAVFTKFAKRAPKDTGAAGAQA